MSRESWQLRFTMQADSDDVEVMVYSVIVSEKWFDDEDVSTPKDFDKALKEAKKNGGRHLTLRVNSPGGDVYSAVAMRSMVVNAGFDSVRVMIEGLCASAATLLATVPGAKVVIAEGSEFMIHNPMTVAWGNAEEISRAVDHLRKMEEQFHGMYAARTGKTEEQVKEWMDAETWFTAREAVENGFCDEMLSAEPVAACVTGRDLTLMQAVYRAVPDCVVAGQDSGDMPAAENDVVSNGAPVAGEPTENTLHEEGFANMDIKDINVDQLRAENPALLEAIQASAVSAERQRQEDIDALTVPGYEAMAAQAKADGTSAMDFQKQIVAAMRQKGANFMQARQNETAAAQEIAGSAPVSDSASEEQEIMDNARQIAEFAKGFSGSGGNSMF